MANGDPEFTHGQFQGMVLARLDSIREAVQMNRSVLEKQEERIRLLEAWRWVVLGMATAGGVGAGITVPKIVGAFFV
jgi:hypothetical protein